MMKKIFIYVGLILICGTFSFGQKQKKQPDAMDNPSSKSVVLNSGTRIDGQLQSAVDVKRSKVGDTVLLKTTKTIKQDGQTVVPKGCNLIGRITEVQQKSKSNGESRLGILFDRIEGKDLAAPISASIVSITNVAAHGSGGDPADADVFGSSNTSGRASGGSSSGGGLLGGVSSTAGGVLNATTQTAGGITNSVGQTAGTATGSLVQTINGIQISNAVSGSVQSGTTLSAADKNIKLEKGTTIRLQLNSSVRSQ